MQTNQRRRPASQRYPSSLVHRLSLWATLPAFKGFSWSIVDSLIMKGLGDTGSSLLGSPSVLQHNSRSSLIFGTVPRRKDPFAGKLAATPPRCLVFFAPQHSAFPSWVETTGQDLSRVLPLALDVSSTPFVFGMFFGCTPSP